TVPAGGGPSRWRSRTHQWPGRFAPRARRLAPVPPFPGDSIQQPSRSSPEGLAARRPLTFRRQAATAGLGCALCLVPATRFPHTRHTSQARAHSPERPAAALLPALFVILPTCGG